MITIYKLNGEPVQVAYEVDALEWINLGLATAEPPAGVEKVATPVKEKAEAATTYEEAVEQFEAPDVQTTAPAPAEKPARKAPRRRSAE